MGGLVAHYRLDEYLNHYSGVLARVGQYGKRKLYRLRGELAEPLRETGAWYETMIRRKYRLTATKQDLIRDTFEVLNALDDEVIRLIVEIQEDEAVDRAWEAQNLPIQRHSNVVPEHPLAAPYESKDVTVFMDRTWFPVPVRVRQR